MARKNNVIKRFITGVGLQAFTVPSVVVGNIASSKHAVCTNVIVVTAKLR
jgi:hypothetical protein